MGHENYYTINIRNIKVWTNLNLIDFIEHRKTVTAGLYSQQAKQCDLKQTTSKKVIWPNPPQRYCASSHHWPNFCFKIFVGYLLPPTFLTLQPTTTSCSCIWNNGSVYNVWNLPGSQEHRCQLVQLSDAEPLCRGVKGSWCTANKEAYKWRGII